MRTLWCLADVLRQECTGPPPGLAPRTGKPPRAHASCLCPSVSCFSPQGTLPCVSVHFFPVSSPLFQVLTVTPIPFQILVPRRNLIGLAWISCPPWSNQCGRGDRVILYNNGYQRPFPLGGRCIIKECDNELCRHSKVCLLWPHRTCRDRTEAPVPGLSE